MDEFAQGDVVELKSGGPRMTIQEISSWRPTLGRHDYPADQAKCYWFDGNEIKEAIFQLQSLKKVIEANTGSIA
ncbi:MAG: DUF2158 domain-containing protein [Spirochaetales bacterium]|nr:DUF2158 domain-containing protein [Spirochaetales bacterium]